ncbi:MAG TPA: bifunctional riboflavin kinase/FAD synthetase [Coriobacteriia bacterium]|nr:bifunctional riboflavin kinase/FAD synthetase [Coriobacteriia bacterium]
MSGVVITWQEALSVGPCVVAIGVFDGVHAGHAQMLSFAVKDAAEHQVPSVALTFDRDPEQVVSPGSAVPQLLTLQDKCAALLETGVDIVLVVPFTPELARMPAEVFLDAFLKHCCEVKSLHVGEDFRFGAKAAGDADTLRDWAEQVGAKVHPHKLLEIDGAPVTSTRIRGLIAEGDVGEAARLMGRAPRVTGTVVEGRKQGQELGFPTANVRPVAFAAIPADGVYAGRVILTDGTIHRAAISVGVPPTFPEARDYLEAHIIAFDDDIYGQTITLEFVERLRAQQAFGNIDLLVSAIRADVERAASL